MTESWETRDLTRTGAIEPREDDGYAPVDDFSDDMNSPSPLERLVGRSEPIQRIKALIEKIADSELSVLVRGESGTGKEIVARLIHRLSGRKNGPFVKVNCAALSESLLESELFGHEKGAFTGAHKSRPGRFELAHRGTIFLDEIGDMAYSLQAKSLQVLEQKEFMPVGSSRVVRVDVRIISATNGILEESIERNAFRRDLLYRLNDVTITMPPLEERKEDIPDLVNFLLKMYSQKYKRPVIHITPEQMDLLMSLKWPGNVRQLESIVKKMIVLGDEGIVKRTVFAELEEQAQGRTVSATLPTPPAPRVDEAPQPPPKTDSESLASENNGNQEDEGEIIPLKTATAKAIRQTEVRLLNRTLNKTRWNRREAAKLLRISYRSLLYKIKKYRLLGPRGSEIED